MNTLGHRLYQLRTKTGKSLRDVQREIGITDSKMSRYEKGTQIPSFNDLQAISKLYGVSTTSLFVDAGYIDKEEMQRYSSPFVNTELLSDDEVGFIQRSIDFFADQHRKREEERET